MAGSSIIIASGVLVGTPLLAHVVVRWMDRRRARKGPPE